MRTRVAIAVYRCEVAGTPTDSIDVQVRYFDDPTVNIETYLRSEPTHSYLNDQDELVTWPFVAVTAIEDLGTPKNGREIAGFITGYDQFAKWAGHDP
jgi:hypothetical protein